MVTLCLIVLFCVCVFLFGFTNKKAHTLTVEIYIQIVSSVTNVVFGKKSASPSVHFGGNNYLTRAPPTLSLRPAVKSSFVTLLALNRRPANTYFVFYTNGDKNRIGHLG